MSAVKKKNKKNILAPISAFFDSGIFPVLLGLLVLLFYVRGLPIATIAVCAACATFICLFCKDTRPAIPIVMFVLLSLRYKDNPEAYTSDAAKLVYFICGGILALSMLYRVIRYPVPYKKKSGLLSVALLCVVFFLGGVFTEYCTMRNFAYAVGMCGALFGTYLFFAFTLQERKDNLLYIARVCAVAICMIVLQVLDVYVRLYEKGTILNSEWKNQIILGWTISNLAAEMIAFMLPAVFYLIYKQRFGCFYWFVVFAGLLGIYFTFARNALLWGGIVTLVGGFVTCVFGKHKILSTIVLLLSLIVGGGGIFLLYRAGLLEKYLVFFEQVEFSDRGRFELWVVHLELFLEAPVQGVGFFAYDTLGLSNVTYAHNTLVQIIASTGIIGLGLYLIHRVHTIYLIFKEPRAERLFIGACILVGIGISFLSPFFFRVYFIVYYAFFLLLLEKSCKKE